MKKNRAPKYEVSLEQRLKQRNDPYGHNDIFSPKGRRRCYLVLSPDGKNDFLYLTHTELVQLKLQGYKIDTVEMVFDYDDTVWS
jgi:hypothetical protein